jgi:hypothetical protein
MPFLTAFMTFEKRLKTMNKGRNLGFEMEEFLQENMTRGVVIMSLTDMSEITVSLCAALQLDKPVTEQVSNIYTLDQFRSFLLLQEITLFLYNEQTTLDIEKLSEIFQIKLKAFLPHLFEELPVESEGDVGEETDVPPTRKFLEHLQ